MENSEPLNNILFELGTIKQDGFGISHVLRQVCLDM